MPRNVRNFWIDVDVDGRRERLSGGPVSKDGGFEATIYMRDAGEVRRAVEIRGYEHNGELRLWVREADRERTGITNVATPSFDVITKR